MCQKRSSVTAQLTPWKTVRVDSCLSHGLETMYRHGIETVGSCCGHGRYPPTIVCKSRGGHPWGNIYFELFSGKIIPRERRFYKKDSKGFYYIPEVSKEKK